MSENRKRLSVAYDFQIFSLQQHGGISKYFADLMLELRRRKVAIHLPFLFYANDHLDRSFARFKIRLRGDSAAALTRCADLNMRLFPTRTAARIYHPTFYLESCLDRFADRPMVVTIYDMIPETFPEMFDSNPHFAKRRYVERAAKVICISAHTKRDLQTHFHVPDDKIAVVHLGIDPATVERRTVLDGLPPRFLLFIGRRGGYKNFATVLRAYAHLPTSLDAALVCIGGGPFDEAERLEIAATGRPVVRLDANDAQVRYALRRAIALVMSSCYEGFGLPIIEAMAQECPLILSNASCFPEIANDAALYFEPLDAGALRELIGKVARDGAALTEPLRRRGRHLVKDFTTDRLAELTESVYRQVVGAG